MRSADDHDVFGDDGPGVQTNFAGDRIEHLVVVLLEIEDAVLAEPAHRNAGLRVERDELIAERHHENALVAFSIGPVRHAAARQQARGRGRALALIDAEHPQQFARRRVDGNGVPPRTNRGVKHAVDHQRRSLKVVIGADAEDIRLESPGDLQLAEIPGVDLIVRDIARATQIAAVGAPFSALRARLRVSDQGDARQSKEQRARRTPWKGPKHVISLRM